MEAPVVDLPPVRNGWSEFSRVQSSKEFYPPRPPVRSNNPRMWPTGETTGLEDDPQEITRTGQVGVVHRSSPSPTPSPPPDRPNRRWVPTDGSDSGTVGETDVHRPSRSTRSTPSVDRSSVWTTSWCTPTPADLFAWVSLCSQRLDGAYVPARGGRPWTYILSKDRVSGRSVVHRKKDFSP